MKKIRPLTKPDGTVAVSKRKYPTLHKSLARGVAAKQKERAKWARVAKLRDKGQTAKADRIAKRLLGIKGKPMDEETKEQLRQYWKNHKKEIIERRKMKEAVNQRMKLSIKPTGRKRIRRKR